MKWILIVVVFWNLENFFDWKADGTGMSDIEFSETGVKRWTKSRFYSKCNAVSKVLLEMADSCGDAPGILAVAEIENEFVLRSIASSAPLRKLEYSCVHYDSPDRRGIDCGLLYRKSAFRLAGSESVHVTDEKGEMLLTRDILCARFVSAEGDSLAVLVNHHPSKLGGGKSRNRELAMETMERLLDSLSGSGWKHILSVGDFNDDIWGVKGDGTIKYNGRWEKIDGCFSRGLTVREKVWNSPRLLEPDKRFGGLKPRRTYMGPRYNGGISDHLPVIFETGIPR